MTREEKMTPEEAIAEISFLKVAVNKVMEQALEMAIKALSQEPCDDAVSRKKAIYVISARDGKSAQIEALEQLPSVTQKSGKWIVDSTVVEKTRQYVMHECGYRRIIKYHMDVHCSKCGFKYAYTTDKKDSIPTNFCPNCGAKMESEDKE